MVLLPPNDDPRPLAPAPPAAPATVQMQILTTAGEYVTNDTANLSVDFGTFTRSGDLTARLGPDAAGTAANVTVQVDASTFASGSIDLVWGVDIQWLDTRSFRVLTGTGDSMDRLTITTPYTV